MITLDKVELEGAISSHRRFVLEPHLPSETKMIVVGVLDDRGISPVAVLLPHQLYLSDVLDMLGANPRGTNDLNHVAVIPVRDDWIKVGVPHRVQYCQNCGCLWYEKHNVKVEHPPTGPVWETREEWA